MSASPFFHQTRAPIMRLTLRTLLAYLDGILDSKDHEELASQIEQSDNAKELIHRTGDTIKRIRLGAPPIDSPIHDPNTVAEYLDNTMSPEEVVEFERRCLESDPELAEVASSHHILTMVLGQRAEFDDDLKRVMYALPAKLAVEQRPEPVVTRTPAELTSSAISEVPDYLRAERRSLVWRVAPAVVMLLLLGVSAWVFTPGGWYDRANEQREIAKNTNAETPLVSPPPTGEGDGESVATDGDSSSAAETPSPEAAPASDGKKLDEKPVEVIADAESDKPETPIADVDPAATGASSVTDPIVGEITITPPVAEPPVPEPPISPESPGALPSLAPETVAAAPVVPGVVGAPLSDPAGEDESPLATDTEPVEPVVVGMVTTAREVLLRYNNSQKSWERPFRTEGELPNVRTRDRLLSLPAGRPSMKVKGVDISLSGATLIELVPRGDSADATTGGAIVRLLYGRLVAVNTGADDQAIDLRVGGVSATATLSRGAVVAVEVNRPFQPGLDPIVESPRLEAVYYAPRGGVEWRGPGGTVNVESRSAWRQAGDEVGEVTDDATPISWLDSQPESTLQLRAAAELERNLEGGEPIWPQLAELYDTRRVEEQAQVAISSMHVGHYGPFAKALSDQEQKSFWSQEIEAMRSTMSRSPELAQAVRDALVEGYGEDYATDLYRMLCGFSAEQVGVDREQQQNGALRDLIGWLESDQVAYRVLANHNIEQITKRRGGFNPVASPDTRRRRIAVFRKRLADGEMIRPDR